MVDALDCRAKVSLQEEAWSAERKMAKVRIKGPETVVEQHG